MSNQAEQWARQIRVGNGNAKAVLMALASYADPITNQCWPSQERLAKDLERTARTVREGLKMLEAKGLIVRETRHGRNGKLTSDLITLKLHRWSNVQAQSGANDDVLSGTLGRDQRNVTPAPPEYGSPNIPEDIPNYIPGVSRTGARGGHRTISIHDLRLTESMIGIAKAIDLSNADIDREWPLFRLFNDRRNTPPCTQKRWDEFWEKWCMRIATRRGYKPPQTESPDNPTNNKNLFWAPLDSPQYEAWKEYRKGRVPLDARGGWAFPTEWPPGFEPSTILAAE